MTMKVMLVDDEMAMRTLVKRVIEDAGFSYCDAQSCGEALVTFEKERPDLMILDVMLPDGDGFQLCQSLRNAGALLPIIFLTAKGDIVDKRVGFKSGGDDYLTKPFNPQELVLRVEAQLRKHVRTGSVMASVLKAVDLEIDVKRQEVYLRDEKVELTPREYKILVLLAASPGKVFTKEQIVEEVWGKEFVGETTSLAVFIRKIREKIEEDPSHPRLIQTVWHVGYRFGD